MIVWDPQGQYYRDDSQMTAQTQAPVDPAAAARGALYGGGLTNAQIQDYIQNGQLSISDLSDYSKYNQQQLENSKNDWLLQQQKGVDASGKPIAKDFNSLIDPATGLIKDQYQLNNNVNTGALDALRTEATRTGPSAWRTLSETAANDALASKSAGQLAQARDNLAMTGGLRGGSAERLAGQSMLANLTGQQANANQFAIQDETNKQSAVNNLAGQELAYAGYGRDTDKYNTDKSLAEILQQRGYDINTYNQAMSAWGAKETAAATPSGGGGGKK